MTRSEARERMKVIKDDCYIIDNSEDKEAFDMAISALEQEPCEDAISRHKAIVMIAAYEGKSAQIEALEQLSSVQPSRKENIECEWAKMTYDTNSIENKIMFEFSDGTKKRVTYTEEIKRTTVGE